MVKALVAVGQVVEAIVVIRERLQGRELAQLVPMAECAIVADHASDLSLDHWVFVVQIGLGVVNGIPALL